MNFPTEPRQKPPTGPTPKYIWLDRRCWELAEAMQKHLAEAPGCTSGPNYSLMLEWSTELTDHLEELNSRRRQGALDLLEKLAPSQP